MRRGSGITQRDYKLEQAVSDRHHTIARFLSPEAKSRLDIAFQAFVPRLLRGAENAQPYHLAYEEVTKKFTGLNSKQAELLCFYIMARAAQLPAYMDHVTGTDDLNEMLGITLLNLEVLLDRRSNFIDTLRNLLEKIEKTQDEIIEHIQ